MKDLAGGFDRLRATACLPPVEVGRQILLRGRFQSQQADIGAGDRLALEVEHPAREGHVILDQAQGQLALCLRIEFRPVRAIALGRGDDLDERPGFPVFQGSILGARNVEGKPAIGLRRGSRWIRSRFLRITWGQIELRSRHGFAIGVEHAALNGENILSRVWS